MPKTLRVHNLAKELGVASKDIIAKCHAEGIELKNHMAAISAGLAESIHEWFSGDEDITSVETASPVDLERVLKPRTEPETQVAAATQVAELPVEPVTLAEEFVAAPHAPMIAASEGSAAAAAAEPITTAGETSAPREPAQLEVAALAPSTPSPETAPPQEPAVEQVAGERPGAPTEAAPPPAPPAPPPPEPIKPAGPQVVPRPADLKGPQVVRIERPDPIRAPRPRPARPARPAAIAAAGPETSEVLSGAARGRGRGVRGKSAERERGQVRPRSPRRHGGQSDVGERIKEWRDQDLIERKERLASATGHGLRERRAAERRRRTTAPGGAGETTRRAHVEITTPIVLRDFCAAVGTPFNFVVARLIEHTGAARAINQTIDGDMAELLALDLGITLTVNRAQTALEKLRGEYERRERGSLQPRPPVVAMLGHVDHGKTSLLDAIRATHVARGEAGGITQHIGAYRVDRDGRSVTFLDTPGHEAFTAMRARGANLTDVVVLVVAADDGVMPQTIEAINHAKAANVQIVVALNKIDRPGVDLNRVYAQLAEQGLAPGEWGGETDVIKTSATTGAGIDELLEHLSTLSELLDLKADPTIPTLATVIEAQMREGQGVVAQVLVREGTLTQGDIIVCGPGAGRVRMVRDSSGKRVKEALPGTPVELSGLDELPQAGDSLYEVRDLPQAKQIAGEVREQRREEALAAVRRPARTLEELLAVGDGSEIPELQIIIKADVHGSVDALRTKLEEFPADKARLNVLHAGVGAISEADVRLAQASQAIIIGFHVVADDHARQLAEQVGVEVRQYRVIYEVIEDMHKALAGLLAPLEQEEVRASIEVRQVFRLSRSGAVAGCFVNNGTVARSHKIRLIRDGRIIRAGSDIASLRRFKEDVREVRAGFECGVKIEGFDDVKPGDVMESYEVIEVAQEL